MATKILTETELQDIWGPSENLQPKKSSTAVDEAQEIRLYEILGEDFYNEIIFQIENNSITTANQEVIDRSKKVVAYWAEFYVLDRVLANAFNKGHITSNSEYGNASEQNVVKDQKRTASQKADVYTERLIKFLCDNSGDYPLYKPEEGAIKNLAKPGFIFTKKGGNSESRTVLNRVKGNI